MLTNTEAFFKELVRKSKNGSPESVCSVCSANRFVIEAVLEEGKRLDRPVLIEATANQINQFGGYTGMVPADFVEYVCSIADAVGYGRDGLILGGDHLGPLVWSGEPEESAMQKAEELVEAFSKAGFSKIHLDCSMRLGSDDPDAPLPIGTVAARAARLAAAAEHCAAVRPVYVIGSEVPVPGGATETESSLAVTKKEDLVSEYEAFRDAFLQLGLEDAWSRVVAVVVQPGVEFGDNQVFPYDAGKAGELVEAARLLPGIMLEGHSTDYQPAARLAGMTAGGVGILKVGPALTFAAREALFSLEIVERAVYEEAPAGGYSDFSRTLEKAMLDAPTNWARHYHGSAHDLSLMRKYSLSDRCRYYMEDESVKASIDRLIRNINEADIPLGVLHQYMPKQAEAALAGELELRAETLVKENIRYVIRTY
ncbi:MAG: class II D-tagatose-bisphosphate aldolase, non-catalytic subunit [Oscillibacter sp.]|nr:class II D-tagatose-bisphosphate aldolase, non-catalytic subunit [Oscillibacter sp.]